MSFSSTKLCDDVKIKAACCSNCKGELCVAFQYTQKVFCVDELGKIVESGTSVSSGSDFWRGAVEGVSVIHWSFNKGK